MEGIKYEKRPFFPIRFFQSTHPAQSCVLLNRRPPGAACLCPLPRRNTQAGMPSSQDSNEVIKGDTMHGERGITETVEQIMEREKQTPVEPFTIKERPEPQEWRPDKQHPPGEELIPSSASTQTQIQRCRYFGRKPSAQASPDPALRNLAFCSA